MDQSATPQPIYNSLYKHGVDEKRRVQIPSKWRTDGEGAQFTLVLWPKEKEGPCLRVLPPKQMAALMHDLELMPSSDPRKPILKRVIGSGSEQVTLDRAGRICIPDNMAKQAGITTEAVFVGLLDRFEIWSPDRHERVQASDAVLAQEAFKMME
jgi:MraZ protein